MLFWETIKFSKFLSHAMQNLPFVDYESDEVGDVTSVSGFYGELWTELEKTLRFT